MKDIIDNKLKNLNRYIYEHEIINLSIDVFHNEKLIITGSFDFSYYHNLEIIFEGVSFLSIPTFWFCKKNWTEPGKDKNLLFQIIESLILPTDIPINFELKDDAYNKNISKSIGFIIENDDFLFTVNDEQNSYYIVAKDIIINFVDLNYSKKEGFLYEFQVNLKSENIGKCQRVNKKLL